jgi:response regulator RpfG family c-di-GMP phosphodiesterase
MKYILLIDADTDILNIQLMVLSSFYGGEVIAVANSQEAIERIGAFGGPELIVSDHSILEDNKNSLYDHLVENDLLIPLIICSGSVEYQFKEKKYPNVSAFVQKPFSIEALSYLVKSITSAKLIQPDFIPVKLPILLSFIGKSFDLYLRLSETNFVKLIKEGESFTKDDSHKLQNKGVTHLYISLVDSYDFLRAYEENLNLMLSSKSGNHQEDIVNTIEVMASIETVSKRLGWTQDAVESAQRSINTAIKILSKDASITAALKEKLSAPDTGYSRHIGLLCYSACIFSVGMGLGGDAIQTKLALAALLHDLAVDENYYTDIKVWNEKAANVRDRTPETIKYRLHPMEASKLVQNLKNLPPDIDQIILQHHEKKDGTGFPRALSSSRITQLATFFNIIEELVDFIGDGENLETSIADFKTWGDANYDSGQFKKTYQLIRAKLG